MSIDDLERAVAEATDTVARIRARNAFATELARTGQARKALPIARSAVAEVGASGDRQLAAESLHALSRCHFYLLEFMPALEILLDAAHAYGEAGDASGQATALAGVGACQLRVGALDEAAATLLRALERARRLPNPALEANALNSLASVMLAADRLGEAEGYLAAGIELAQRLADRNLLTKLLTNRSLLARKQVAKGDAALLPAGLDWADEALALARELGNRYDEAFCLAQLGTMQRLAGRMADGAATLGAALALAVELDEPHLVAETEMELGRVAAAEGDLDAALRHIEASAATAARTRERELQAEVLSALSAVHEQRGELAAALAAYKRFHALRERELEATRSQAARASQLWLDFERAERDAATYRAAALAAEQASQRDPLTGLLNRRGLEAGIQALLAAVTSPVAVALIDIDHFKDINDLHSHAVGDAVLVRIAATIRDHARTGDLAVRLGGDEFALVLTNVNQAESLRAAERIGAAVQATRWQEVAPGLDVSVSIGVARHAPGSEFAATLAAADQALYAAKAAGRARAIAAG